MPKLAYVHQLKVKETFEKCNSYHLIDKSIEKFDLSEAEMISCP